MSETEILTRKIRALMGKFDIDCEFSADVRYSPQLRVASAQLEMEGYKNTVFMGSTDESIINQLKAVFQRERKFYMVAFVIAYYIQLLSMPLCYALFTCVPFSSHWEALLVMAVILGNVYATLDNYFTLREMAI